MRDASRTDDVSAVAQLVSAANEPDSMMTAQEILDLALQSSTKANATSVLSYSLEHGADIRGHGADLTLTWGDYNLPSLATLDMLIAHGWNIDSCGHTFASNPLLWAALRNSELVEWCLSHGASVDLPTLQSQGLRPILERAAAIGNITIFEELRKRGAPLSPRVLPTAVRSANDHVPKPGESSSAAYEAHLNMVRHLIDDIGIDVNVESYWAGSTCSTPLCCIACYPKGDATLLIELLLEKGGDPHLAGPSADDFSIPSALEAATARQYGSFVSAVEAWQLRRAAGRS